MKSMLRIAAGLALSACFVVFAGCASSGAPKLIVPPQQLLADFCPVVNADLKVLASSPLLTAAQRDTVSSIEATNTEVCSAGAQIDLASLHALNATAFPALLELVSSIPGIPDQPAIMLGLTLAQPILAQVVQSIGAASEPAAPASAASGV